MRVQVSASDAAAGVRSTLAKVVCNGVKRASQFRIATSATVSTFLDRDGCGVIGRSVDKVGRIGSNQVRPMVALLDASASSKRITLSGGWRTTRTRPALKGTLATSTKAGAQAKLDFEGDQFAVVVRRGPRGGLLELFLDGQLIDTIDTYSRKVDDRRIMYVGDAGGGTHTLRLRATGTASAGSAGTTVGCVGSTGSWRRAAAFALVRLVSART